MKCIPCQVIGFAELVSLSEALENLLSFPCFVENKKEVMPFLFYLLKDFFF